MESTENSSSDSFYRDFASLDWQIDLGVTDAICEAPVNRYELPEVVAKPKVEQVKTQATLQNEEPNCDPVSLTAETLGDLKTALLAFSGCALKQGARNTIFAGGNPQARVMIVTEPPDKEEDRAGTLFQGPAQLLIHKMMAAIGLSAELEDPSQSFYYAPVFPWRGPANRDPDKSDLEMMKPFILHHIALAKPDFLLLMGRSACRVLLNTDDKMLALRGQWFDVAGTPTMPIYHPEFLLRNPNQKRAAWLDLLSLKQKLDGTAHG